MYINFCAQVQQFLQQFKEDKQHQVCEFLAILGMDMAKKLGQSNTQMLYHTLKQLARNILQDSNTSNQNDLREEIRKIQMQLGQLNQLFLNESTKMQNRFYTQNDCEEQLPTYHSPLQYKESLRSSLRSQPNRSPNQDIITAKITESPPPAVLYIQNVNTKLNVKPHLDDHQIKQLLYSEKHDSQRMIRSQQSPPPIRYQIKLGDDNRQQSSQPKNMNFKKKTQQSQSRGKRKTLPIYLQNVESKIKAELDHDKQMYKQQKVFINPYEQDDRRHDHYNGKRRQSSQDTYLYEWKGQQKQNVDYSPVIQMNSTPQYESQQRYSQNQVSEFKREDSDSFSNFTPPNEEIKNFFQRQHAFQ